jgi:hypothetical protein
MIPFYSSEYQHETKYVQIILIEVIRLLDTHIKDLTVYDTGV